jgi:hypothetical protein
MNTEPVSQSVQPVGKAIAAAFVKAQADFGPALKTSQNPHFRSKYASLDACIEAVIDALHKHGIGLLQRTLPCENGVAVETLLVHTSGETLSGGVLHVPASKQDPQGYGSALTYARRYHLLTTCGIAPEDDDGNAASRPSSYEKPSKPAPRITDEISDPIIRSKPKSNGKAPVAAAVASETEADDLPW